jgi:DNA-binding MarR family transcriptional regulator
MDKSGVWIIGDGAAGLAEAAVEAVGAAPRCRIAWDEPPPGGSVLLVEAEGADAEALAAALPRLAGWDQPVVVVMEEAQVDLVAGHLLGGQVELLCHPSPTERIAALAVALRLSGQVPTHLGENEAARLAQFRAQVARIADTLARLAREEPLPPDAAKVADRELGYAAPPLEGDRVDPQALRRLIRARRQRERQFGMGLFEDPAWDMMLDLYAAHLEDTKVSVSSLCIAAAVPPTTALRWIGRMISAGLFLRAADPEDRRRALMTLTDRARTGMAAYHATLAAAGLPLV